MKRHLSSTNFSRASFPILAGVLFALASTPVTRAQTGAYTIVDLGSPSGTVSVAYAINNAGQVVGTTGSGTANDPTHAALWTVGSGGTVVGKDLGVAGDGSSSANGINEAGLITGDALLANGFHATYYRVGSDGTVTRTNLGAFGAQDGGEAFGYGINASGQVAGYNQAKAATYYHAFLFALSGDTPVNTDLGTLGGDGSQAFAINEAGLIVGNAQATPGSSAGTHPFFATLWTPKGDGTYTASNLGTIPGGTSSAASGLNNVGQVVGNSSPNGTSNHAVLFTLNGSAPATVKDLGSLGTYCFANAINDAGQIVGNSTVSGSTSVTHGFLYTAATGMRDINSLVGSNPIATGITAHNGKIINKFGQIALTGTVGGKQHALVLNPVNAPVGGSGGTRETPVLAGKAYNGLPVFTNPTNGSRNSQFGFLDGIVGSGGVSGADGSNRDVTVSFITNPASTPLASDAASVAGTAPDVVTVQMSYAPGFADAYFNYPTNGCLGWFNGTRWVNAVDGNTGGAAVFAGNRAYNAATDFHLGTWGIDTSHGVAWAVVNHGGTFGVTLNPDVLRTTKPASRSGTVTTLAIDSFTGHVYQLQHASALTGSGADFVDVENAQNGSSGTTLYLTHDDGAARQGFYRIKLDP